MSKNRLSKEILGLLGVSFAISFFLFQFLSLTAVSLVRSYLEKKRINPSMYEIELAENWVKSLSLLTSVVFFLILFLFLLGQKVIYIHTIIKGVEALRMKSMDFCVPVEGNNELTELAESINYLAMTERRIKQKEKALAEEKEQFIRSLSHDIRTPLTSILAYTQYIQSHGNACDDDLKDYLCLVEKKAEQMKELTDVLLDGGKRKVERIENIQIMMFQLLEEWKSDLEEDFSYSIDLKDCPKSAGDFDVQELCRIFDNLSSNIKKYADPWGEIKIRVFVSKSRLVIEQKNLIKHMTDSTETVSGYQIGLNSIRRIAYNYGGGIEVDQGDEDFSIRILLSEVEK